MRKFEGKIAVVTGAARGIGREIAICFAEEGAAVVLVDRIKALDTEAEILMLDVPVLTVALDITDELAVKDLIGSIHSWRGPVDILVNNAGIIAREGILDLSPEVWRNVMNVNVNGTFYMCKAVLPDLVKRRLGKIINISSIAGKIGDITASPAYGTSKGAINTFTRSLARQLAEHNITVNAVAPHAIETEMSAEWSEEKRKKVIDSIPLKRMGTAREVAHAALFLASDEAAFITGETLNVNGGYLMD
jgi:3-oxoacyl-[acyl-carrier protein] reductase